MPRTLLWRHSIGASSNPSDQVGQIIRHRHTSFIDLLCHRAPRATLIQKAALELLNKVHANDSTQEPVAFTRPDWVYLHDCQWHAYQEYDTISESLKTRSPYSPTNVPRGTSWNLGCEGELASKLRIFKSAYASCLIQND